VRIVDEIALGVASLVLGQDRDAVLVGADHTVRTQPLAEIPRMALLAGTMVLLGGIWVN